MGPAGAIAERGCSAGTPILRSALRCSGLAAGDEVTGMHGRRSFRRRFSRGTLVRRFGIGFPGGTELRFETVPGR